MAVDDLRARPQEDLIITSSGTDLSPENIESVPRQTRPTLKVKRAHIQEAYGDRFARLYESV